jgi:indolepyruvate ferredoxin oxidoreductase
VAAHLEGLYSSNLDVTGLAQKYGAVLSHVKLAPDPALLHATRVAAGEADALIGCDLIVSAGDETFSKLKPGACGGVVCTDMVPTSEFSRNPDWNPDADALAAKLAAALGDRGLAMEALRLSAALMGDSITANMFMLGAAWQKGLVPLTLAAIDRAIELNGVAIEGNRRAFLWGRRAAHDLQAVERIAAGAGMAGAKVIRFDPKKPATLAELMAFRIDFLTQYQDAAYANRYAAAVERVKQAEAKLDRGDALSKAVAKYLFKLMAHKDEWEVARLYARPEFRKELEAAFEGDFRLKFHVAGGPFGRRDPVTGRLVKREVGPWLMTAFRAMAPLRRLRGSVLDPFRGSSERRLARGLLETYEADLDRIVGALSADNHAVAVKLASLPEKVRGYGHVREEHAAAVAKEREVLLGQWTGGGEQAVELRRSVQAA